MVNLGGKVKYQMPDVARMIVEGRPRKFENIS